MKKTGFLMMWLKLYQLLLGYWLTLKVKLIKRRVILAHQKEKFDVLPWVKFLYITHVITPKAHILLLFFFFTSSWWAEYLRLRLNFISAGTQKYARQIIQHEFEERLDKSVPRVTVWHHSVVS